jgi:hypothetical protein
MYICTQITTNKKKQIMELTLNEILNSDLLNEIIIKEDLELAEAGWTYEEVRQFAKSINKNVK